ncbi:MAG: aminomethyltransferase family protein [Acidobacteriales bacterium]|nr:aminomethyltransferase family protein [Terriglobales bacterium]
MTGYEALRHDAAIVDLSHRGKIRVEGEDRARLLHAMSTNHVQNLLEGHGLYTFFLNEKGRILADAYIYCLGSDMLIDTEPETAKSLYEHLDRYIIADDVTLTDETERWAAIGLEGPRATDIARNLGYSVPQGIAGVAKSETGFLTAVTASGADGVRFFVPTEEKTALIDRLKSQGAVPAGEEELRIVRLENGRARFGEDISERYLVQETRIENAVHSNKGCYLGQEIVERVRSRGQVHRLLTPIRVAGKVVLPAGTKLNVNGKDVAEVTATVFSPDLNEVIGLAYVRAEVVEGRETMAVTGTELPVAVYLR